MTHDAPITEIDLNCDAGESFGLWPMGDDEALMPLMTSVNIACGAHAGDPLVMRRTLLLAKAHNVAVGAHPGYPDLYGFGRRALPLTPDEVEAWTLAQLGALDAMARGVGTALRHVKPHGALYNTAADDEALAEAIVRAVCAFDPALALVARAGSPMARWRARMGYVWPKKHSPTVAMTRWVGCCHEVAPGALLDDPQLAAERAVSLLRTGELMTAEGVVARLRPQTLCIHSDTRGAVAIAGAVRAALLAAGITLRPLHELAR